MRITDAQCERIAGHFLIQRGNVKTENRDFGNAILYISKEMYANYKRVKKY